MLQGSSLEALSKTEKELRAQEAVETMLAMGSYSGQGTDEDGHKHDAYKGEVRHDKRLDVVLGPPSAGKSSVLVNPISEKYGARVLDSDMIKEMKPEFNGGLNANYVHEESKNNMRAVRDEVLQDGDNVVLPIVGGSYNSVMKNIQPYLDAGYSIHLHLVDLDYRKALGRMLARYLDTGRYIPAGYLLNEIQNHPRETYEQMKGADFIASYEAFSNDVRRGEKAVLLESSETNESGNRSESRPGGMGELDGAVRLRNDSGEGSAGQENAGEQSEETGSQRGGEGTSVSEDVRYSIPEIQQRDTEYQQAVDNGDMETAQRLTDEAAQEAGYTIHAYHGTGRGDRVGNVFRPERATSGPMAFFTSDRTVAENYAKDKRNMRRQINEQALRGNTIISQFMGRYGRKNLKQKTAEGVLKLLHGE